MWEPEVALRLLVSGCRTRAELAELAQYLGVKFSPSATKLEIETEILALAILSERDRRVAEMRKLRYRRGVEQELERKKRRRNPVPVKAKKKSSKEKTPTALAPHETAPDPSSSPPAALVPDEEICNACHHRINADGSCGCC